jgi:hypothetical protein
MGPVYQQGILLKSFIMARVFGQPTVFGTITLNPHHPAITANIRRGETYGQYALLISQVAKYEFLDLMKYIEDHKIFGNVKAVMWRIEYQKRGLPYYHVLWFTDINTSDLIQIDKYFTAEFPRLTCEFRNASTIKDLRTLCSTYQIHRCTARCKKSDGSCKYGFPKPVIPETYMEGPYCKLRKRESEDAWVVAYHPEILALYRGHIDMEPVGSKQVINYLMKYAFKDSDSGFLTLKEPKRLGKVVNPKDKIRTFSATMVASAAQCISDMFGDSIYMMKPAVLELSVHLENRKIVFYLGNKTEWGDLDKPSKLERYFCRPKDEIFNNLTFCQYYSKYIIGGKIPKKGSTFYDCSTNPLPVHENSNTVVTGIRSVRPSQGELYWMRVIILTKPARSFKDLRTINGQDFDTYHEAAVELKMAATDNEFKACMADAVVENLSAHDLRVLACILMVDGANYDDVITPF